MFDPPITMIDVNKKSDAVPAPDRMPIIVHLPG
jgi:hypothetical protein